MPRSIDNRRRFYLLLAIGSTSFATFLYYTHLEITDPDVTVAPIIFFMLLGVMGGALGIDVLSQVGGGDGYAPHNSTSDQPRTNGASRPTDQQSNRQTGSDSSPRHSRPPSHSRRQHEDDS